MFSLNFSSYKIPQEKLINACNLYQNNFTLKLRASMDRTIGYAVIIIPTTKRSILIEEETLTLIKIGVCSSLSIRPTLESYHKIWNHSLGIHIVLFNPHIFYKLFWNIAQSKGYNLLFLYIKSVYKQISQWRFYLLCILNVKPLVFKIGGHENMFTAKICCLSIIRSDTWS